MIGLFGDLLRDLGGNVKITLEEGEKNATVKIEVLQKIHKSHHLEDVKNILDNMTSGMIKMRSYMTQEKVVKKYESLDKPYGCLVCVYTPQKTKLHLVYKNGVSNGG